jgi:hypothetical protein
MVLDKEPEIMKKKEPVAISCNGLFLFSFCTTGNRSR